MYIFSVVCFGREGLKELSVDWINFWLFVDILDHSSVVKEYKISNALGVLSFATMKYIGCQGDKQVEKLSWEPRD